MFSYAESCPTGEFFDISSRADPLLTLDYDQDPHDHFSDG